MFGLKSLVYLNCRPFEYVMVVVFTLPVCVIFWGFVMEACAEHERVMAINVAGRAIGVYVFM